MGAHPSSLGLRENYLDELSRILPCHNRLQLLHIPRFQPPAEGVNASLPDRLDEGRYAVEVRCFILPPSCSIKGITSH